MLNPSGVSERLYLQHTESVEPRLVTGGEFSGWIGVYGCRLILKTFADSEGHAVGFVIANAVGVIE